MESVNINGAVLPSLSAMSFGPQSFASEPNSFVVLERETAEGLEPPGPPGTPSDSLPRPGRGAASAAAAAASAASAASLVNVNLNAPVSNHFGSASFLANGLPNGVREVSLSAASDGSYNLPSNIQQRMDDLIQENIHLQVTVDQTNMSLRQMMSTLSEWRQDREKVLQEHKEKFQETRILVMNLKKEKSEMRAVIEELRKKVDEFQTREENSSFITVEPTVSEIELKSTVADLQSKLNILEAAYQAEQEKNKSYEEEIKRMKEGMNMMQDQIKHFEHLQQEVTQAASSKEITTLREENKRLQLAVENLNSVERHSQDYQAAQARGFIGKLDELSAKLIKSEQDLQTARLEIDQLKSNDRTLVTQEETLTDALATVDRLRARIDEMTVNIVRSDEMCEKQARDIAALQGEKTRLNEAVGILQAQADVYQADFLAERECRERLAVEKEQLAEDLRRLHRHNQQLQQSQNQATAGGNATGPANVPELPAEEAPPNSIYRCVVCKIMTFRSLQALNEHIDHCLDNSAE